MNSTPSWYRYARNSWRASTKTNSFALVLQITSNDVHRILLQMWSDYICSHSTKPPGGSIDGHRFPAWPRARCTSGWKSWMAMKVKQWVMAQTCLGRIHKSSGLVGGVGGKEVSIAFLALASALTGSSERSQLGQNHFYRWLLIHENSLERKF